MPLGPALLFLATSDWRGCGVSGIFPVFGRGPLFLYVLHLYLVLLEAIFFLIASRRPRTQTISTPENPNCNLRLHSSMVFAVRIGIIFLPCMPRKWHGECKTRHKNSIWLSYSSAFLGQNWLHSQALDKVIFKKNWPKSM
jgi:hypothetical protein